MKFILALLTLSTPLLHAQTETQMEQFNDRLTALEQRAQQHTIYNSSARPEVKEAFRVYVTGDLLWWKAQENGLEYAVKTDDPFGTELNDKLSLKNLDFDYAFGFRTGIGYNLPHDKWDIYLNWTQFSAVQEGHSHVGGENALLPIWSSLLVTNLFPFLEANTHWHVDLSILDGEVGRDYYFGKWATVRPSIGLRTVWIKQHYNIHYEDFLTPNIQKDTIRLVNDFSGIGPKAALDTQWFLCWGFGLYGNGSLSLLYGEFETRKHEELEGTPSQRSHSHDDYHIVRAVTDLQIGLSWDCMFLHDQFHLGVRLGWEQMLFWGMNQFYRLGNFDSAGSIISNLGDLTYQGATFSLRLDF